MSIIESLKRLVDPAAARQEEAERRADREKPIREDAGPDKWFECRVCHYLGADPTFCPKCLAGTMRPTRARPAPAAGAAGGGAPGEARATGTAPAPAGIDPENAGDAPDAGDARDGSGTPDSHEGPHGAPPASEDPAATALPFDGTLDLHTFAAKEVRELLPEYLTGCQERGQRQVRIIHGKGTGALRRSVHALLRRDPRVESFRSATEDAGGWGATLVTLRPA